MIRLTIALGYRYVRSVNMKALIMVMMVGILAGCAHSSWETGAHDRDLLPDAYDRNGHPASLFEMSFGDGETEVTKNIPADAATKVGDAVKTLRGKSPADVTGE